MFFIVADRELRKVLFPNSQLLLKNALSKQVLFHSCSNPNASKTDLLRVVISFLTVHLGGGLWGVLSVPIFNKESGIFVKGNELAFRAFGWNLLGVLVIMAWSAAWAIILFFALHLFKQLRVSEEIELKGKYLQYF